MILLLDTDVLIDIALDRAPHAESAAKLLDTLEKRPGMGRVAWHSVSNFYYLVRPDKGHQGAKDFLGDLAGFVEVAPTTTESLRTACQLEMKDFEDAMQVAAALACGAQRIVTRNLRDYKSSPVKAIDPPAALSELAKLGFTPGAGEETDSDSADD